VPRSSSPHTSRRWCGASLRPVTAGRPRPPRPTHAPLA
jgi:hypothetical protein